MKKAIITGASSGLGKEIGKLLHEKGITVINLSRKPSIFEDINVDLADDATIAEAVKSINKTHTDCDVLILNAGIMPLADTGSIDFDIDKTFKVNITGTIKLVNEMFGILKKNNADIVIIGSTASFKGAKQHSVYSATKHASIGFIRSLQAELQNDHVRVIGFHPGGFNSNLRGGIMKEGYMKAESLATFLLSILELPKEMEVSEVIINRKKAS